MRYLDHAATTPVRAEALEAALPWLTSRFGNPSSTHEPGLGAAAALDDARARVARVLGMRRGDIVFTSGGSEANNLAVKGLVLGALPSGRRHLITTPIEHESVLQAAEHLRRLHGVEVTHVDVAADGRVDPAAVAAALRDDTALVSIGAANNEIGTVQDLAAISSTTKAAGVPHHTDAVQAAGWLPLDAGQLGVDALSLAGHKVGALPGTGVLAVRGRLPLEPLVHGGGQERGRRSGTESVAGAVSLAVALELADAERIAHADTTARLRDDFIRRVLGLVPEARLTGSPSARLPASASFVFPGVSGESILLDLERVGIVCSSGSACAAGHDEPSHVLLACGVDVDDARTAVRFTLGHDDREPLDDVADALARVVQARRTPGARRVDSLA